MFSKLFKKQNLLEKEYVALLNRYGFPDPRLTGKKLKNRYSQAKDYVTRRHIEADKAEGGSAFSEELYTNMDIDSSPLQDYVLEIKKAMKRQKMRLRQDVFVGEFPTGSFNAQAVPVKGGSLLLLNSGLMMTTYQLCYIIFGSMRMQGEGLELEPILDIDATVDAILGVLVCYFFFGDSSRYPPTPTLPMMRNLIASGLVTHMQEFALAHEYGHAVAGHLDANRTILARMPVDDLQVYEKRREQEFEADRLGMTIMLARLLEKDIELGTGILLGKPGGSKEPGVNGIFEILLLSTTAAPFVFFEFDTLISEVAKFFTDAEDFSIICDHPPSSKRSEEIREFLEKSLPMTPFGFGVPIAPFGFSDGLVNWISFIREKILKDLRENGDRHKRLHKVLNDAAKWDQERTEIFRKR